MIQFHESEYCNSPMSDEALRLIALFVDRDTYDKLLYRGTSHGLDTTRSRIIPEIRTESNDSYYVFDIFPKAAESAPAAAEVSTMAHSG